MDTPVVDFVERYVAERGVRLHMPGHKGKGPLGCEAFDITEIKGADALYEAEGIIARSEENAAALFGTGGTFYSTEGSSQCIRAMLYLALTCRKEGAAPVIVAARNVHKAFVYAAALLDFEVVWLWPKENTSLCACPVTPEHLDRTLKSLSVPPAAVYVTSPDYLGNIQDIRSLAEVAHRHGTILAVDNAHGAYLHFLDTPCHPMDLGADLCCDSAHKTLPVLTGGAYLHIHKAAPASFCANAKEALALFGSTSPSYLTLLSLDSCNRYLAEEYVARLRETSGELTALREKLKDLGWKTLDSDPLRITLAATKQQTGTALAEQLRRKGIECEFADPDFLVLMATPENSKRDFACLLEALGRNFAPVGERPGLPLAKGERVCSIREALFAPHVTVPVEESLGSICAAPTVSCPPAIPIVISGERVTEEAVEMFCYYGVKSADVLK